jgi:GR25 family glycosyltransferase involved in LPS biosynthesis
MSKLAGFYINLDRSNERRAHMDTMLAKLGVTNVYARVPAIEGAALAPSESPLKPGELGCFLSHLKALKAVPGGDTAAHVMEDDVILSPRVLQAAGIFERAFETFDIVFTETFVGFDLMDLRFYLDAFKRATAQAQPTFRMLDISRKPFAGATSYYVAPRAVAKLVAAEEAALAAGPKLPIDIALRLLANAGQIRAGVVFPFMSTIRLEDIANTTIAERAAQAKNPAVLAAMLLRYAFYIDSDIADYARRFLDQIPAPAAPASGDPRRDLIMKIASFVLSDEFRTF